MEKLELVKLNDHVCKIYSRIREMVYYKFKTYAIEKASIEEINSLVKKRICHLIQEKSTEKLRLFYDM